MTDPAPPNALREQLTATPKRVELVDLATLTKVQLRDSTDTDAVARYAQAYKDAEDLPPIVVFRDGDHHYLADGHHRVAAAKRAQLTELHAIVKKGDRRAAVLYAAGANGQHGLPLTNADKRKIVGTILADSEWKDWSNREIARVTRTSEAFVRLVRKETGAEVTAIKRADGTTQKSRNSEAKKPKQQSLLDPLGDEKAMISDTWTRVREINGLAHLPEIKCRILVALYWYGGTPDTPMKRDILAKHIDAPLDVHPGQLAAAGNLTRVDYDGPAFALDDAQRNALRLVLEPAIVPHAPPVPTKPTPPPSADLGRDLDRAIRHAAARFATAPAGPTTGQVEDAAGELGINLGPHWFNLGLDGLTQDRDGGWHTLRDDPPTGPEDITVPPAAPPAAEPPAAPIRPLGLRRLDKQREILHLRLRAGKLAWQGSDDDLFLLALIAGVPSTPTAWIDAARATARVDFLTALARECADRVRSGETMNARKWPQLPELCRLWGLDHQAIEIEAERAVPA